MELPCDSRFRLCETTDGSWQLLRAGEQWMSYLGFDPDRRRFVCVSFSSGAEKQGFGGEPAALQRLEGIEKVAHPTIGRIFESGRTEFGNSYCVYEFVEGESLLDYLRRNPDLPDDLLGCLLLDLADALEVLAEFPRFLSCIEVDDFLVTLDRGIFPGLRLGRFGLNREDQPVSDFQLAERWMGVTAGIQLAMKEGGDPSRNREDTPDHSAYAELRAGLQKKSGVDAILHLKELNFAIQEVAGIQRKAGHSIAVTHRKLRHIKQVAVGPLQKLLFENDKLASVLEEKFEIRKGDIRYGVSPFMIPASILGESNQGDIVHLYLLPPERLFEESFIEPLNRKMFDGYLKSHPNGVRGRSLTCEKDFTILVADRFEGLPLPSLQARRSRFSRADTLAIVRQLDRILGQFESARFPFMKLSPWQIEIYFESAGPGEIPDLIENIPLQEWPAWDIKLRVEAPAEVFIEPACSVWSHLIRRFQGRSFPAIVVWLLEGDRFEWVLRNGNPKEEPLSWNPHLEQCLTAAASEFDDADASHRERLIQYVTEVFEKPGYPFNELAVDGKFFRKLEKNTEDTVSRKRPRLPQSEETVW